MGLEYEQLKIPFQDEKDLAKNEVKEVKKDYEGRSILDIFKMYDLEDESNVFKEDDLCLRKDGKGKMVWTIKSQYNKELLIWCKEREQAKKGTNKDWTRNYYDN